MCGDYLVYFDKYYFLYKHLFTLIAAAVAGLHNLKTPFLFITCRDVRDVELQLNRFPICVEEENECCHLPPQMTGHAFLLASRDQYYETILP